MAASSEYLTGTGVFAALAMAEGPKEDEDDDEEPDQYF